MHHAVRVVPQQPLQIIRPAAEAHYRWRDVGCRLQSNTDVALTVRHSPGNHPFLERPSIPDAVPESSRASAPPSPRHRPAGTLPERERRRTSHWRLHPCRAPLCLPPIHESETVKARVSTFNLAAVDGFASIEHV